MSYFRQFHLAIPSRPAGSRLSRAMLAAIGVLLLGGVLRAQLVDQETIQKRMRAQREAQYKQVQTMVASMQPMKAQQVNDVLQLKLDGANLTLVSPAFDKGHNGAFRVECDQFKGPTYAQVSIISGLALGIGGAQPGKPAPTARIFTLVTDEMPTPDELVTVTVQSYPGHLQIDRQSQLGLNGSRMVRLMQQRPADAQGGPGGRGAAAGQGYVQLTCNEFGDGVKTGGLPRSFNIQSADFESLLRDHPRESDEFVRPLLRQIGQEAILAPDARVAWQVLSDHWRPDPAVALRLMALLPALNEGDFHARDKALADMQQTGMTGAAVLTHLDRLSLTPEQNLMIDRMLAPFTRLSRKDVTRLRSDSDFLMDCLYVSDHDVRAAALDQLKQVTGKEVAFEIDVPDPDRPAAVSALRRQLTSKPTTTPATAASK